MASTEVIKTALNGKWVMVDRALEGLDDATLAVHPPTRQKLGGP